MKKIFTVDDIMVSVYSAIGYGLGYNVTYDFTKNMIISIIICLVLGTVLRNTANKIIFSKNVQSSNTKKITIIIISILVYLIVNLLVYHFLNINLNNEMGMELLFVIVIPVIIAILSFIIISLRKYILKIKFKDGSAGYQFNQENINYIKNLNGENKEIIGIYDKNLAVKTRTGIFVGNDEKGYISFKGIPYAKNITETGRWQKAKPLDSSDKVYEAKYYGYSPHQEDTGKNIMIYHNQSENCLNLNIWTKNLEKKNKPVIVHIFSSVSLYTASSAASPLCNPSNFVKENEDVIFVNFNYRQTIFATPVLTDFTNDKKYKDSNLLEIYDVILALQWIKENIEFFGGDKENITLLGNNVGGIIAQVLYLVKEADGLFNKVIDVAGSINNAFDYDDNNRKCVNALSNDLNVKTIDDFVNVDAKDLIKAEEKYIYKANNILMDEKIFGKDLNKSFLKKKKKKVDFIFIITENENSNYKASMGEKNIDDLVDEFYDKIEDMYGEEDLEMINYYRNLIKEENIDEKEKKKLVIEFVINKLYIFSVAKQLVENGENVYIGKWNVKSNIEKFKSNATSFLISLFKNNDIAELYGYINPEDIGEILRKLVVKFVKNKELCFYNNEIKGISEIKWEKYNVEENNILYFKENNILMKKFEFEIE